MMAEYKTCENLNALGSIKHGFFTRKGGVSSGVYSSLNCGFGSDDRHEDVRENRNRLVRALGVADAPLISPYQIHSADVAIAVEAWGPNEGVTKGLTEGPNEAPKADAIVTKTRRLAIGVLSADCTPILFCDENAGVIGAAHAGWRGAVGGIIEATIEAMISIGASKNNIRAGVGPCLHQKSFEVGLDFYDQFIAVAPEYDQFFIQNSNQERPHFDMPGFVMHRLREAGITNTENTSLCTYENESLFFSYRRNTHQKCSDYGRQMSAIVLT